MSKKPVSNFPSALIEEAFNVSRKKEQKTVPQLLLKTGEEVGEMFQAWLSITGAPANRWRGKTNDDFYEEQVDVLLCLIATMAKSKMDQETFERIFQSKLGRWQEKLDGKYKKPSSKVYILYGDNPGDGSFGVFSSRESALKLVKKLTKTDQDARNSGMLEYSIEEREVEG